MVGSWSKRGASAVAVLLLAAQPALARAPACPAPGSGGMVTFPDGALAMRTGLAVNPDGAGASYTPGDHGYTYINNGVNLIDGGKVACSKAGNGKRCATAWRQAEAGAFGPGTPEFCVYAMEVEKFSPAVPLSTCEGSSSRFRVGNGKGRPKSGITVPVVSGGTVTTYLSTTSLRHTVGGAATYIDSAAIPALVAPTSRPELVGAVVWVRFGDKQGFAIVGDTGPAFGEGSVALHQLLRNGAVGPVQPVGPLPLAMRCSAAETGLKPPFLSRPDAANDKCRSGYTAKSAADIRAYQGIESGVESIVLTRVKPPMTGRLVREEVTPARLEALAAAAGYSRDKLATMAACLRP